MPSKKKAATKRKVRRVQRKPNLTTYPVCGYEGCRSCGMVEGVALGRYHTFLTCLGKPKRRNGRATLYVGCRVFTSADAAREHWQGGVNQVGEPRPRAGQLLTKAAAVAKQMGWRWVDRAISSRRADLGA